MKKAYRQETLEALVSDSALRECRAVRVQRGMEPPGPRGGLCAAVGNPSGFGRP